MRTKNFLMTLAMLAWIHSSPAATWYVATNGNDSATGDSWATAKLTIQSAVDASTVGDTVLVNDGTYATGSRIVFGTLPNRVAITKAITVQSVNGPNYTTIQGSTPLGSNAVRCVYINTNGVLSGFTLSYGATLTNGDLFHEQGGGGVWCETNANVLVTNCILSYNSGFNAGGVYSGKLVNCNLYHNTSKNVGGGALNSTLINCTVSANTASWNGGGAESSTLSGCILTGNISVAGGGVDNCSLSNCVLAGNSASGTYSYGGASYSGNMINCKLVGNSASYGGGSYYGALTNCLVVSNAAAYGGGEQYSSMYNCTVSANSASQGGGAYGGAFYNCIIYGNTAGTGSNYVSSTMYFCCTAPSIGGSNFTNSPGFAGSGNFHISTNSPCFNAGSNLNAPEPTDLDGNPRISGGKVDLGAYEVLVLTGYNAWSSSITNGLTNYADCATGDGYPNLLKYATGSSPTTPDLLAWLSPVLTTNGHFAVAFNRNTNAVDVTIVVEESQSAAPGSLWQGIATNHLGSWGGATNVTEVTTNIPTRVTVQDNQPASATRYLRLRVTRP